MSLVVGRFPRSGVYGINRDQDAGDGLEHALRQALRGGLAVFQYRRKSAPLAAREGEAARLLLLCRRAGIPFIVNDDVELTQRVGADGVHLGREDVTLIAARQALGPSAIIGVSCYDSVARAQAAERDGADYVAFGRFFPSRTKPSAMPAPLQALTEARRLLRIPVVAIGGITPENGAALLRAGAEVLAVVEAVFGAVDPEHAVRAFGPLFSSRGR